MSEDLLVDISKNETQEQKRIEDTSSIVLSEYAKKLENHIRTRYLKKIEGIGVDPACLQGEKLDAECLPPIEATDLLSYLVLETSFYTLRQFKAFKSLESYNQMVSGFITSVQGKAIGNKFVVLGKVRHSQRMNEPPIPIWIIANGEGTIISAHCLGCKAGLAECCSHVGSVLFYIEAWNRIHGKLACTEVKCTWLLPTYVNEVPYAQVEDINFKSARKLKDELDVKIDGVQPSTSTPVGKTKSVPNVTPTETDMKTFFAKLNESQKKPVILSLVAPYADQFVLKSRRVLTIPSLYNHENLKLNYPELLQKCCKVELSLSDSEIELIEQETRDQSKGTAFFKHRAGRVGASMSYSVANTNPDQPSISLIKNICYPQLFSVQSKAINHGIKNEGKAIETYNHLMSANHKDFVLIKCGVFIDKQHPWMHATPDFLCSCSCCGDGCGEVKCPYIIENWDFESYVLKKSSCLEKVNGIFRLKRKHQYYYQVQQQLSITGRQFCDFVVCAFSENKPQVFIERILPETSHWEAIVPKVTKVWQTCILPEILARWYTRKQHLPEIKPANKSSGICYCGMPSQGRTIHCSNPKCLIKEFHQTCLHLSDSVLDVWYCPNCRLLAEFQCKKPRKAPKPSSTKCTHNDQALKLDSICVCGSSPMMNERLLKCHSENCQNGKFFHLQCLDYKRMPNNSQTTWVCSNCKVSQAAKVTASSSIGPTTCSSSSKANTVSAASTSQLKCENSIPQMQAAKLDKKESTIIGNNASAVSTSYSSIIDSSDDESDVKITQVTKGVLDKRASLGSLNDSHFDIINSPTGWLDCTIIQKAQVHLQKVNPLIESFQKTTLGPIRNFDVVTSEFVQILHTGHMHWVCISSIGCRPGMVNLYDSLYHDIIAKEVEEQVESLMADSYVGIENVTVQQQLNGSDCGIFAIAFATCLVYGFSPRDFTFDIPKMRPHLAQCLEIGKITMFPSV